MEPPPQLPERVQAFLEKIQRDKNLLPIDETAHNLLYEKGESAAMEVLKTISSSTTVRTLDGFIIHLCKPRLSSPPQPNFVDGQHFQSPSSSLTRCRTNPPVDCQLSYEDETEHAFNRDVGYQCSFTGEQKSTTKPVTGDELMEVLNKLEFNKLFLVLSYIGERNLECVLDLRSANYVSSKNHLNMSDFERAAWETCGNKATYSDRNQRFDWDCDKAQAHLYYCDVHKEGRHFKGPFVINTRTHLQRSIGDDNVLIVRFFKDGLARMQEVVHEGIDVGSRHYRFFVFKDDLGKGKNQSADQVEEKISVVKCYFVHFHPEKSTSEARQLFMHVHTVSTLEKYMARFSLILSKTYKLPIDFEDVKIETIDDIPFKDKNGCIVCDEDGNILVHTDGTGYISEDLAQICPKDFTTSLYSRHNNDEKGQGLEAMPPPKRARSYEPPLLMQGRLFYKGCAVKGTFLVNKKLGQGTIQVRHSMIKVVPDKTLPAEKTFNSLEVVNMTGKPARNYLSKTLIALLSYGGVPLKFFLDLLTDALEETDNMYSNKRAALRVVSKLEGLEYAFIAKRMIASGMPLDEPYLRFCLSELGCWGRVRLGQGRISIDDSYYLMGTADPTGHLKNNEVCIVLEHGPIEGDVLVYRNPGLHFGDVHIMKAKPVKGLDEVIGNSKYGIFFSTQGSSSASYEMATGDFDGDMYWVSRNHKLLDTFKASSPWKRHRVPQISISKKVPHSPLELEDELIQLMAGASKPSFVMANACHSWLSYMDRLLTLGNDCSSEKKILKEKMLDLIDIYYDALDAPKTGKQGNVPVELIAEKLPHHMKKDEKGKGKNYYHSTSVLGQIYDNVDAFCEKSMKTEEINKLPLFDAPNKELEAFWKDRYAEYRNEMKGALASDFEVKNDAADAVILKYKRLLYMADKLEESTKNRAQIFAEALAIYHVTYERARSDNDIKKCGFAWKVAGSALYEIYASKEGGSKEEPLIILPSVLRDVL